MRDGGGTKRPLDQPARTAISQSSARTTGTSRPSAGRAQRATRTFGTGCSVAARSEVAVMATRDTADPLKATITYRRIPAQRSAASGDKFASIGRRNEAIVDEIIDALLDVD